MINKYWFLCIIIITLVINNILQISIDMFKNTYVYRGPDKVNNKSQLRGLSCFDKFKWYTCPSINCEKSFKIFNN